MPHVPQESFWVVPHANCFWTLTPLLVLWHSAGLRTCSGIWPSQTQRPSIAHSRGNILPPPERSPPPHIRGLLSWSLESYWQSWQTSWPMQSHSRTTASSSDQNCQWSRIDSSTAKDGSKQIKKGWITVPVDSDGLRSPGLCQFRRGNQNWRCRIVTGPFAAVTLLVY